MVDIECKYVEKRPTFFLFVSSNSSDSAGKEFKCSMTETCYENVHLRPPEVGALLRGVSDYVKESGCRRTNMEAISDMLRYTIVKPIMQMMNP